MTPFPIVHDLGEVYTIPLFIAPVIWKYPFAVCFVASVAPRILVGYFTEGSRFILV